MPSSQVKQIRRSNSDRAAGVEKTRLIKHSMVTDTQARRIITVSNIDQVIFFLIINVNVLFLSGYNTASKMQRSYDSIEIQSPLISHSPTKCFVRSRWVVTRNLCLPVPRLIHRIYIKKALRHSCTTPTDCINSTSQDWDMVVQRLPWLEKMEKFFENVINGLCLAYA